MSEPFDRIVEVPAGFGAYERAMFKAVSEYGLDIQLDQVGWTEDTVTYLVGDVE